MNTPDPNSWDDLFRQRLEDYESEPAPEALDRILLAVNGPVPKPASSVRGWLVVVVGLLLLGGSGWLINRQLRPVQAARSLSVTGNTRVPAQVANEPEPVRAMGNESGRASTSQKIPDRQSLARVAESAAPATRLLPGRLPSAGKAVSSKQVEDQLAYKEIVMASSRPKQSRRIRTNGAVVTRQFMNQPASVALAVYGADRPDRAGRSVSQPVLSVEEPSPSVPVRVANREQAITASALTIRPLQLSPFSSRWPSVSAPGEPTTAPISRVVRNRPSFYVSAMPLFTYHYINPVSTDQVYVRSISPDKAFSSGRVGWQMQVGAEWSLSRQLSLRTGLAYGVMQQSLRYTVSPVKPDSIRLEVVDNHSVRITPIRNEQTASETTRYQYVGLAANLVWSLTTGSGWRPYLMAGATVGGYVTPVWRMNGFVQASAGLERPLTSGLWLRIEPTIQYGWSPVSDVNNLFVIRPYTYGLTAGLRFR